MKRITTNMSEAVQFMSQLIDMGVEYPEAQYNASQAFEVDADELQTAYDDMMMETY